MCFFSRVHHPSASPDRWKTHGVMMHLVAHNTRQATYKFTLQNISLRSYEEMLEQLKGTCFEKDVVKSFGAVKPMQGPEGKVVGCGILLVFCQGLVLNSIPHSFELGVHVPSNWDPSEGLLHAPAGINLNVHNCLLDWWQKQRAAGVFCCVNMFNIRPGGPSIVETIWFDIMYSLKKEKYRYSPLGPVKQPWSWLEARAGPTDTAIQTQKNFAHIRQSNKGEPGIIVTATLTLVGITISESYFIHDSEMEKIEIRDDWAHHFYTLLVDYDLKY